MAETPGLMDCGHPKGCIVQAQDAGWMYCGWCASEGRAESWREAAQEKIAAMEEGHALLGRVLEQGRQEGHVSSDLLADIDEWLHGKVVPLETNGGS